MSCHAGTERAFLKPAAKQERVGIRHETDTTEELSAVLERSLSAATV